LARLGAAVAGSGDRAVVVAVHGLGGVGKSTLAARFAEFHADRFSPVWWVTADSPAAIEAGLAELAGAVAPEVVVLPSEQRVELGLRWLASHDGWLLVLDNVTAPRDVEGLLGRVRTGTVVVTSRRGSGWRGMKTVPLDVLSEREAVELLVRVVRSEWPDADLDGADRLRAELGRLPLAVEQAAAYPAQTRITPTAYLERLREHPVRMFTATAEGGDAQRTMARVWHVTLDHLADTPTAGQVLRQPAWYAPDGTPRTLVGAGGIVGEPELSEALGRLAAYNMITLTTDTVSVHRLVRAVTRTPDPTDPHRQPADIAAARDAATAALTTALAGQPHDPAAWPTYRTVLPHARTLLDHTRHRHHPHQLAPQRTGPLPQGPRRRQHSHRPPQPRHRQPLPPPRPRPPRHTDLTQQPGHRLQVDGRPGPGDPAVRNHPHRPSAGVGSRSPHDQHDPVEPQPSKINWRSAASEPCWS
jgi:hypothetical protein